MFINIKTFGLKIITITFLIIFALLFSKHFEIHLHNIARNIHSMFLKIFIIIKTFDLIIITKTYLIRFELIYSHYFKYMLIQSCLKHFDIVVEDTYPH